MPFVILARIGVMYRYVISDRKRHHDFDAVSVVTVVLIVLCRTSWVSPGHRPKMRQDDTRN